ncbi:MAG: cysteine-rich KTR domain-containing protein [[Ruminococcus] torques]
MISEWIICPICGNKTRDRVMEDTVFKTCLWTCIRQWHGIVITYRN